jgi:glycosyltransferase involved in cell wall biosynthesis
MKLSVFMLAYNHERFIEQAIRSVLMQRARFDFELVVGEDASTDGTAEVVRRLQTENPDRIRATCRVQNVGMHRNFIESYQACSGEYVAFLDGDDYWTSPDKLQKQVDFLDSHPGYSMCFHNALIRLEDRDEAGGLVFSNPDGQTTFEIEDLIVANIIPGCSIMARNRLIDRFPGWLSEVPLVDWVFNLLNARHGSLGYLNEPMAVYRQHAGGVWSPHEGAVRHERILAVYDRMPGILDPRHRTLARTAADKFRFWAGNEWLRGQVENYKAETDRLGRSIEWLQGQIASHEASLKNSVRANDECLLGIAEVEKSRADLARQLDEARTLINRLDGQARAHAAENARLQTRLREIESSRGWRLLSLARLLVNGLGRRPLGRVRLLISVLSRRSTGIALTTSARCSTARTPPRRRR